ncbi:hypothetical protein [Nonomuraea sp. NEAU-A123]|uniref:hypothetical protein n=1 Tax=Nonomuraea sp. NEAU-A123 TaxID=2839649 RepID=UPI001BE3DD7C|nr:hypothetical protein [Nonomuraea sp. NEAU-A123]MBT2230548.1 hypothetical protein [Nonomuraea sp. NEAU-A123]
MLTGGALVTALLFPPAAALAAPSIPKNFLLYEKEARKDIKNEHWLLNEGSDLIEVENIACSNAKLKKDWIARRDLTYDPRMDGDEKHNAERGEQVFLFAKAAAAEKLMTEFRTRLTRCGKLVKVIDPKIGDGSVGASRAVKSTKSNPVPQTLQFVAVRKGAAVAIYWDRHNDAPAITTMARHKSDATKMAAKLCRIGGC